MGFISEFIISEVGKQVGKQVGKHVVVSAVSVICDGKDKLFNRPEQIEKREKKEQSWIEKQVEAHPDSIHYTLEKIEEGSEGIFRQSENIAYIIKNLEGTASYSIHTSDDGKTHKVNIQDANHSIFAGIVERRSFWGDFSYQISFENSVFEIKEPRERTEPNFIISVNDLYI